jgi:Tfp pilus assembly protein PilF
MLSRLGEGAIEERHVEIGRQNIGKRGNLHEAEESLRLALQKNPDNAETMLLLAQLVSKFQATEEGEALYRKALPRLSQTRPGEAMEAFRDYYRRYFKGVDYQTLIRLSGLYQQQNDFEWSGRCLEFVLDDPATPATLREKLMFQCARAKEAAGNVDAAEHYYRQFLDAFPQSPMAGKIRGWLAAT